MENNTIRDSSTDVANENGKSGEDVEASEENNRNDAEEKLKEVKDGEEGRVEKGRKITDENGEKEGKEDRGSVVPPFHRSGSIQYTTAVSDSPSPSTPANGDTCPDPPPRQRRKSKGNRKGEGEKETHEKAHGEEEESERREEKKEEDTGIRNAAEKTRKDITDTTSQKEEDNKDKSEKTTHTKQENDTQGSDTRNRSKKTERTPNTDKEAKPAAGKDAKDPEKNSGVVALKQELSLLNCVGLIVGNIIGTGIFVAPRAVLQYTGSVGMSLIVWVVSGVMAIIGAFCYVELGTMIPQSGGNYTYLYEAYGSLPAFIYLWVTVMIGIPGNRAVAALTFANYVLQPFFPNEQSPPDSALRIFGILLIIILTYINFRRVRWATRVQDLLAMTKVFALIMIIVVGLFHLTRGTTDNYVDPMEGTSTNPALVVTAFYHTLYAYDGWDSLNSIMEELKDPLKNMPRAIAISVTCVMVIYILTNVAYFAVMPKELMLASSAVAVTFGNLVLGVMAWTIPIFVACSISGGLNGSTFSTSRLLFVGARNGHLPRFLSFVHVGNNTPVTSLFFLMVMSMWMFVTSDVRILINYLSFAGNLMTLVCVSTFFWFRWKHPDLPRPIKVWIGFPIIYIILAFFLCVMPIVQQPLEVVVALIVIATGLPVYYFCVHKKDKPKRFLTAMEKVTYVSQLLFMAVPEERAN